MHRDTVVITAYKGFPNVFDGKVFWYPTAQQSTPIELATGVKMAQIIKLK